MDLCRDRDKLCVGTGEKVLRCEMTVARSRSRFPFTQAGQEGGHVFPSSELVRRQETILLLDR